MTKPGWNPSRSPWASKISLGNSPTRLEDTVQEYSGEFPMTN
jgi:hypothetical protein